MAKASETKTKANTPSSYTRNGNTVVATWTIRSVASTKWGQQYDYRILYPTGVWGAWGGWKDIGVTLTSVSFNFTSTTSISGVEVKTRYRGGNAQKQKFQWSDPTSSVYYIFVPKTPSLSVSKDSSNQTTFTWSTEVSDTDQYMFDTCYYRTYNGSSWTAWAACAASGSLSYTDASTGFYRYFQIYSHGRAGDSPIVTGQHYIGMPPRATWASSYASLTDKGSYYDMTLYASVTAGEDQVDEVSPEYYIGTPTATMQCPSGANFSDGVVRKFSTSGTYYLPITTGSVIDEDECLWARIQTKHDDYEQHSSVYLVRKGRLSAPEATFTMGSITASGFSVTINITDAVTNVPGAYIEVYLERQSRAGTYEKIGTIANGTSSATINSTINLTSEDGLSIHIRNVTADGHSMTSDYCSYTTTMPASPTLNSVTQDADTPDKVFVSWTQNWTRANGTIIAWTDDPDNWMSNDEPDKYEVTESASGWYIVGLETGKTWYFKVRSVLTETDSTTYTSWSNEISVDLSADPITPALYLSEKTITEDGMVTAYWAYASGDGTPQIAADIAEMSLTNNEWTAVGTVVGTGSAQHVDIYASQQGWTNGDTVYLSLRTRSGSGGQSEYSTPVRLVIAETPTVTISSTSLSAGNLTVLPLTATIATSSASELSLAIERADDYPMIQPDGTETAGKAGETIYVNTVRANLTNTFTIELADLIGRLDDGALYRLVATVTDEYGQTAEAVTEFRVNWSRQAWTPTATIVNDATNMIVRITPIAGEDYEDGDTCDIYRLSVDGAELVYKGAQFGTEYVDPYPAFGEFSGYRVVTVTSNGDYITEDNLFAMYDTGESADYEPMETKLLIIDFNNDRLELQYNIDFSNEFEKDFQETKYLGGSIKGDWNKTTSRTGSASSVTVPIIEEGLMRTIRRLASYSGICHVRTPDGSSYAANVNISDSWSHSTAGKIGQLSLNITRIDTVGFDGMTYEEWSSMQ